MDEIVNELEAYINDLRRGHFTQQEKEDWLFNPETGGNIIKLLAKLLEIDKKQYGHFIELIKDQLEHGRKAKVADIIDTQVKILLSKQRRDHFEDKVVYDEKLIASFPTKKETGEPICTPQTLDYFVSAYKGLEIVQDDFNGRYFFKTVPWDTDPTVSSTKIKLLAGQEYLLYNFERGNVIHTQLEIELGKIYPTEKDFGKLPRAVANIAERNKIDTHKERIRSIQWDGVDRIFDISNNYMVKYMNADPGEWTVQVARLLPLAIVSRGLTPGEMMRLIFVFEGGEKIGKGEACGIFAFGKQYHEIIADFKTSIRNKPEEFSQRIANAVVIEFAELARLYQADADSLKEFVSRQSERWRVLFTHSFAEVKRRSVIIATTNKREGYIFSNDENTRFIAIYLGEKEFDLVNLEKEWPQVIAQAVTMFDAGEKPFLPRDKEHLQKAQNRAREVLSREEEAIEWYFYEAGAAPGQEPGMLATAKQNGLLLSDIHRSYSEWEAQETGVTSHIDIKKVEKSYGRILRKLGCENGYSTAPGPMGYKRWWFVETKGKPPRK